MELPKAPPLLWSQGTEDLRQGKITNATLHSDSLDRDKKVLIYTPPGFNPSNAPYPLLVAFDGDRNIAWIPKILDVLIASKRIPPLVAVMTDDSVPSLRQTELPCNPKFARFLAEELVPWMRKQYRVTTQSKNTVVAGSSYGGLAAVFAGLQNSDVFGNVISLSGSFWWKPDGEKDGGWLIRQIAGAPKLPLRFYLEIGLMEGYDLQVVNNRRMRDVLLAKNYVVGYSEFNGGHSFLTWSNGMVAGLTKLLPLSPGK